MLDAFSQWASNPTSISAGSGIEQNYPYINKNLMRRYDLSSAKAGKLIIELKNCCDDLIDAARSLPGVKYPVDEVQSALIDILSQSGCDNLLRQGVLKRLRDVSEETRKAVALFNILDSVNASVSPDNFTESPGRDRDYQSEFEAYYNATYGQTAPVLRVKQELVKSGVYNELFYRSSLKNNPGSVGSLTKAIMPTASEMEALGVKIPQPDVPALIESYWTKKDFEILRFVDILSHSSNGIVTGAPCPAHANIPGFMGAHGKCIALAPGILNETKHYIELMKNLKMEPDTNILENAVRAVKQQMKLHSDRGLLWTAQGETVWRFSTTPPLYVYLSPWLTSQSRAPSCIDFKEKPHILLVTPWQAQASLLSALDENTIFSTINTRGEKSLGIMTNLEKPDFRLLTGQRHPLIDKLIEAITAQPRQIKIKPPRKVAAVSSPAVVPPTTAAPVAGPDPAEQLVLGDRVSPAELRDLMSDNSLNEDRRREQLSSQGLFQYPIILATSHTAIFGTNNSGKSTTVRGLVKELIGHGVPVTIIDWHDEYINTMRDAGAIIAVPPTAATKPGAGEMPFTWNILDPRFYSPEITPDIIEDYIQIIVDLMSHKDLMDLSDPMKNCLTDALRSAYKKKQIPTLKDALELVADMPASDTQDAVIRRLKRFSGGSLGSIFCSDTMTEPISMFSKSMDVSVKNLTVDYKSSVGLLTFFLMRQALSYFKRKGKTRIVQHVIVIDEAPMVIGSNSKVEEEVVSMLQEIRKFGVGLILVCRNPGIGDDILRETNQKIAHRLAVPKDVTAIGEMLGLSAEDQKLLPSLPSGVAFARIGSNPTALVRIKR